MVETRFTLTQLGKEELDYCLDGDNLTYSTLAGRKLIGLQCSHIGGHGNYEKIQNKCKEVIDLMLEIDELNKR